MEMLSNVSELRETVAAYKARDPAARSALEILLLYPGVHAVQSHRRAHWCYRHNLHFLGRLISQWSRFWTGIEITPAPGWAEAGSFDHGMGIVIGENGGGGDDVLLYQGVTLAGTGKDQGKRHPTIGSNVLIGSGAKVLGPFKVGDNSRIAAGAVVLNEIPPDCTAVGVPARVVSASPGCGETSPGKWGIRSAFSDPLNTELANLRERWRK
jgi:serine O-acetyltransferase